MILGSDSAASFSQGTLTEEVRGLIGAWCDAVALHRGGDPLVAEILEITADQSGSHNASCWTFSVEHDVVGFAIINHAVVKAIFVVPAFRRRGIARDFLAAARIAGVDITDAYALPGDRATKSLYESLGWTARLLTMRPSAGR